MVAKCCSTLYLISSWPAPLIRSSSRLGKFHCNVSQGTEMASKAVQSQIAMNSRQFSSKIIKYSSNFLCQTWSLDQVTYILHFVLLLAIITVYTCQFLHTVAYIHVCIAKKEQRKRYGCTVQKNCINSSRRISKEQIAKINDQDIRFECTGKSCLYEFGNET